MSRKDPLVFVRDMIYQIEIIQAELPGISKDEFLSRPFYQNDKLAHGYATVDLEETWNTLIHDIPPLYEMLMQLIN